MWVIRIVVWVGVQYYRLLLQASMGVISSNHLILPFDIV